MMHLCAQNFHVEAGKGCLTKDASQATLMERYGVKENLS